MARPKYPHPQSMRLSRECESILDDVSDDLGLKSRAKAIEVITRHLKRVRSLTPGNYSDILLAKDLEPERAVL